MQDVNLWHAYIRDIQFPLFGNVGKIWKTHQAEGDKQSQSNFVRKARPKAIDCTIKANPESSLSSYTYVHGMTFFIFFSL